MDSNQWLTPQQRQALQKRSDELNEKRHGSRLDKKFTFDFAGTSETVGSGSKMLIILATLIFLLKRLPFFIHKRKFAKVTEKWYAKENQEQKNCNGEVNEHKYLKYLKRRLKSR
jgi:predicted lipid carrier protein YhbT